MTASNSLPSTPPITHPAKLSSRRSQERINKGVAYVICTIVALAYVFPLYWMSDRRR